MAGTKCHIFRNGYGGKESLSLMPHVRTLVAMPTTRTRLGGIIDRYLDVQQLHPLKTLGEEYVAVSIPEQRRASNTAQVLPSKNKCPLLAACG